MGSRPRPLVSLCFAANSRPVTLQRDRRAPCGRPRPSPPIVLQRGGLWAGSSPPSVQSQHLPQKTHSQVYVAARVALRVNYHTGANAAVRGSFTQARRNSGIVRDFELHFSGILNIFKVAFGAQSSTFLRRGGPESEREECFFAAFLTLPLHRFVPSVEARTPRLFHNWRLVSTLQSDK